MLSQNLVSVLGFSWLRLCRNQRWMLRTSQSSCLERPSSLFSSGCYETKYQENHSHLHHLQICPCLYLRFPPAPIFTICYWHFHIYHWEPTPSIHSMNTKNHFGHNFSKVIHCETTWKSLNFAVMFALLISNKDSMEQLTGWVSFIRLQGKAIQNRVHHKVCNREIEG